MVGERKSRSGPTQEFLSFIAYWYEMPSDEEIEQFFEVYVNGGHFKLLNTEYPGHTIIGYVHV